MIAGAADLRLNNWTATFGNKALEAAYLSFLYGAGAARERIVQFMAVGLFLCYGALDVLAVGEFAREFLFIRFFIVAPVIVASILFTSSSRFRKYLEWTSAAGFAVCAAAIIYMIQRMPMEGAPPYIVGLLFSMILSACLLRFRFAIAMPTYLATAAAYCLMLSLRNDAPQPQVASGYFFMLSVTTVAGVAIYVQETRARVVWLRDLQRKQYEERIAGLLIEATAADRSKINFLSILTHELRTPLHQIIGFSEVMKNQIVTGATENLDDSVEHVLGSARSLLSKIGQMLRYADATAGKLNYSLDQITVTELVEQLSDQFTDAAKSKSVEINMGAIGAAKVEVDSHHTLYAISSIIQNALDASSPGSMITVDGGVRNDSVYELRIADNGPGMTRQMIDQALKPFEQVESARSRKTEGLGLGLAIATHLLVGQKGGLEIVSAPGAGTTVHILLPLAHIKEHPSIEAEAEDCDNRLTFRRA